MVLTDKYLLESDEFQKIKNWEILWLYMGKKEAEIAKTEWEKGNTVAVEALGELKRAIIIKKEELGL